LANPKGQGQGLVVARLWTCTRVCTGVCVRGRCTSGTRAMLTSVVYATCTRLTTAVRWCV